MEDKASIELMAMDVNSLTSERDALLEMVAEQKAEIERLQKAIKVQDIMIEQQDYKIKSAKSEAYREFANLVNRRLNSNTPRGAYLCNIMKNVEKELTEK